MAAQSVGQIPTARELLFELVETPALRVMYGHQKKTKSYFDSFYSPENYRELKRTDNFREIAIRATPSYR